MHPAMFFEANSVVSMIIIVVVAWFLTPNSMQVKKRLKALSDVTFYIALAVSSIWIIYWLSHIEHMKQVGFILAYPSQLLLFASLFKAVATVIKLRGEQSKAAH